MKTNFVVSVCVAGLLAAGAVAWAQSKGQVNTSGGDPRIDKVLEQNEKILKNQEEILKQLEDIKTGLNQVRRRTS